MKLEATSLLSLVLLVVAVPPARSDSQADGNAATARQIIERALDATGGRSAWSKLNTSIAIGSYEEPGGAVASVEFLAQEPSKYLFMLTFDDNSTWGKGYDGKNGWNLRQGTARDAPAELLGWIQREVRFARLVHLGEMFPTLRHEGETDIGGRKALVVTGTAPDGMTETWSFDAQTGLMIGRKFVLNLPDGSKESTELVYDDYREVNGVKVPFVIRQISPSPHVITLTQVTFNTPIESSRFTKPTSP